MKTINIALLLCTLVLFVQGCSNPAERGRKNVSGVITLDGEPLPSGTLAILPIDISNPDNFGIIGGRQNIVNGKYSLQKELGLLAGTYAVHINSTRYTDKKTGEAMTAADLSERPDSIISENIIPQRYRGGSSELKITVGEEKNQTFDFHLTSDKKKGK